MELMVNQKDIQLNEVIFECTAEQPVDCEFTLPDYCEDIERILKCTITSTINSSTQSGQHLNIDGTAYVHVMYTDSETAMVRGYEMQVPFSKSIDTKKDLDKSFAKVTCKTGYVNARAVNTRKMDVHAGISISVNIIKNKDFGICSDAQGGEIQLKKTNTCMTNVVGVAQKQLIINEELELGAANSPIKKIIKSCVKSSFEECKILGNKGIIKGTLQIMILYCSEENKCERFMYSLPINQIVEVNNMTEDCDLSASIAVCATDIKPRTDMNGEARTIIATVKALITATATREENVEIITDAYSTYCDVSCQKENANLCRKLMNINESFTKKETIVVSENFAKDIIDIWCETQNEHHEIIDDHIIFSGEILCNMLVCDEKGSFVYHDKTMEYSHKISCKNIDKHSKPDVCVNIKDCSFNLVGNDSVEIRTEICIVGEIKTFFNKKIICSMNLDTENLKKKENIPALTVYYADAGESVWEIAQRYNTSLELIMKINGLTEDKFINNKMILVPAV